MVPGPTRYADSHVQDIKSAFELFITPSIEKYILGDSWKDFDVTDLQAYIGLLILAGLYKSKSEATARL